MDWIIHIKDGSNKGWALCGTKWEIARRVEGVFTMCMTCQELGLSRIIRTPIKIPTMPPQAYLFTRPDGEKDVFHPADITVVYANSSDEGYVLKLEDGGIEMTNDDPENWKKEAVGPYIQTGLQDKSEGYTEMLKHDRVRKALRDFEAKKIDYTELKKIVELANLSDNFDVVKKQYSMDELRSLQELELWRIAPDSVPVDSEDTMTVVVDAKTTTFIIGEDSYCFGGPMYHKQAPWTAEEVRNFHTALQNYNAHHITLDKLWLIAANPDMYDAMGYALGAKPAPQLFSQKDQPSFIPAKDCLFLDTPHMHFADGSHPEHETLLEIQKEAVEKMTKETSSAINQYRGVEVIDVTQEMNFCRGNAVKYIARAGFKSEDTEIQDLEKALWYVEREISEHNTTVSTNSVETVQSLVEQMNYNRGNAVWKLATAGGPESPGIMSSLNDASNSIRAEIFRLKELIKEES